MKPSPASLAAALLAFFVSGCATSGPSAASVARIQEKSDVFAKLTPEQQKLIQNGVVERGFTPDMVYMVLGKPTTASAKDSARGKLEMWTYLEYVRPGSGAQDNRNNPGEAHYTTQTVAPNSAPVRDEAPSQVKPLSFGAASASMGPLHVADLEENKVYLFFANGRVAEIKLESRG